MQSNKKRVWKVLYTVQKGAFDSLRKSLEVEALTAMEAISIVMLVEPGSRGHYICRRKGNLELRQRLAGTDAV